MILSQSTPPLSTQKARVSPPWLTRSVMYQIYLRSFTPEGTLAAATARLDRVAELRVDVIYLCPVFLQDEDMREEFWSTRQKLSGLKNPRNPYRIKDFYAIDPEYGTASDLHQFVDRVHELGMRILFDLVYFHCGPTAPLIQQHPDYVKRDEKGQVLKGEYNFPVMNFENAALRAYFFRNMLHWVEDFRVDGFRCDVAADIPLDFWEEARRRLEGLNPEIVMLSEAEKEEDQLFAFDLNYNFTLTRKIMPGVMGQDLPASDIRKTWEEMKAVRPLGSRFLTHTENHDIANDTRQNRHDANWGLAGASAALVLMFTLDGMPMLYNGQEVADTAPHSLYGNFAIDWNNAETTGGQQRWDLCQKLCELRHCDDALGAGDLLWLDNSAPEQLLSFLRTTSTSQTVVLINISDRKCRAEIEFPESGPESFRTLLCKGILNPDTAGEMHCAPFGYWVAEISG